MVGLYIHFPFCERKCPYCDFYSAEKGDHLIPKYLDAVVKEAELYADVFPHMKSNIQTVYFGGGTPSLLWPAHIETLLREFDKTFGFTSDAEITIEVNPGTVSLQTLRGYRSAGINRISIGVQSFNANELRLLGRIHTADQAENAVFLSAQAGFEDIGIDLIYGIPSQPIPDWRKTLTKAVSLMPTHISTYALTWDTSTVIGRAIEVGELPRPDEDTVSEMFLMADNVLSDNGYKHYEVSNFAKPGYRCRHNEGYWTGRSYLGLGPSAHSFVENQRFWNVYDVNLYITVLSQNQIPVDQREILSTRQRELEGIALGLRRQEGIAVKGMQRDDRILGLVKEGLASLHDDKMALTSKGLLLADEIALHLVS
jgi:oxygen-independent coproporphyrinogen-3 oxidase